MNGSTWKLSLILLWAILTTSLLNPSKPIRQLSILHFNDAYDIEKSATFTSKFLSKNNEKTIRLFSGDLYSPSTVSLFQKGAQFQEFLKRVDLTAAVIGNHEFDFGEDWFLELRKLNPVDWLNGNLRKKDSGELAGQTIEFKIIERGSLKIGVFGLVDQDWLDCSSLVQSEFELENVKLAGRRISQLLKKEGCELIIALTHMQNSSDLILLEDSENEVDLVLGGHDHIYLVQLLNNRLLLKSGCDFSHFSHLQIDFGKKPINQVTNMGKTFEYLLDEKTNEQQFHFFEFSLSRKNNNGFLNVKIEKTKIAKNEIEDLSLAKFLESSVKPITSTFSRPVFVLDSDLETRGQVIRHQESAICDFVVDLVRIETEVDIALLTAGGFRLEQAVPRGSVLRYIDMIHLLPFHEEIIIFWLTGRQVIRMLEEGISSILSDTSHMTVSGITFEFEPEKQPMQRIVIDSVRLNGLVFDINKVFKVATSSFIGKGKAGFEVFAEHTGKVQSMPELSPLKALKIVWEMAANADFLSEFNLFKNRFDEVDLDFLSLVKHAPEYKKIYYSLDENILLHENPIYVLNKMSSSALRRIMFYSVLSGLKEVEGIQIFSIDLQNKRPRIRPILLQDL